MEVIKFMYLFRGCWHSFLQHESGDPMEAPSATYSFCENACPFCQNQMINYIAQVRKDGIIDFIIREFVQSHNQNYEVMNIVTRLQKFENVGKKIYNCPRSQSAPEMKYLQSTILQLIVTGLLCITVSDEHPKAILQIGMTNTNAEVAGTPKYLIDSYWEGIHLVPLNEYVTIS